MFIEYLSDNRELLAVRRLAKLWLGVGHCCFSNVSPVRIEKIVHPAGHSVGKERRSDRTRQVTDPARGYLRRQPTIRSDEYGDRN